MELEGLKTRFFSDKKKAISKEYALLEQLVQELQHRDLPPEVIVEMNQEIERLNDVLDHHLKLYFYVKSVKKKVLNSLLNDLEIVPKNYYRNLWSALGMLVFGVSLGVVFTSILDKISAFALGLPIGMAIGLVIGIEMDRRALENNKQLEFEIN